MHPNGQSWLMAGLTPDVAAPGLSDLVLGGAVDQGDQWHVTLLVRWDTSWYGKVTFDWERPCTTQIISNQPAIVAGCQNGGSDAESFVTVFGLVAGAPKIFLVVTCGQTNWKIERRSIVIVSTGLRGGNAHPGAAQPNVTLDWLANGSTKVLGAPDISDQEAFSKYCTPLTSDDMGPA
jgi:hypothetical protein